MNLLISMMLVCSAVWPSDVAPNPEAVADAATGRRAVARASWWGFDPNDATASLQAAIDSGAQKVILEDMGTPWIVDPITLASDQELVLEEGVVLLAKRGGYTGRNDCLLEASGKRNIRITGPGATLRMWRSDYDQPPYEKAEWRHAISIRSCTGVRITGLTIVDSGGDGIYLGVSQRGVTNTDVEIRDVVCDRNYRQGISVISAENLLIENTTLRATAGTAPQAGIDFEPNYSLERLVNCVMRNCLVEGNAGDGFLFALHNLAQDSTPVSIRIENCRSQGNRSSFRLHTGNGGQRSCVPGVVEVIDCRLEGSEQAGIVIGSKPADGCHVRFERCSLVDPARGLPRLSPILFQTAAGDTRKIGGVEFTDCTIVDSQDRRPLGYNDRAGGLKLVEVTGTLTVEREGQQTLYALNQKILDEWLPFQAFKEFPPVPIADWQWEPTGTQTSSEQSWSCNVRQRGRCEFILRAEAGREITFTLGLKRVGRTGTPKTSVAVIGPSGRRNDLAEITDEGERTYTVRAEQAGWHRVVCDPGTSTVHVVSSNVPVALHSERAPMHLLGSAGDLYFCVPAGVEEFAIRISGGGEGESVKATVYDADDRNVGEKDNIEGHQFLLSRPRAAEAEIWRLHVGRPSQGVLEDYYVQLQGIPPILATSREAVRCGRNGQDGQNGHDGQR